MARGAHVLSIVASHARADTLLHASAPRRHANARTHVRARARRIHQYSHTHSLTAEKAGAWLDGGRRLWPESVVAQQHPSPLRQRPRHCPDTLCCKRGSAR
eukprot:2449768-Pleurochrysis_carterae.AAC.1